MSVPLQLLASTCPEPNDYWGEGARSCFWWACPACGCMSNNMWALCDEPWHAWWRALHGMSRPTDVPPNTCFADGTPGEWPRWDDRPFEVICEHSADEWDEHVAQAMAEARGGLP